MWSSSPRKRCRSPRPGGSATSSGPCRARSSNRATPPPFFFPAIAACGRPVPQLTDTGITLQIPVGAQTVEGRVLESRLPGSNVKVYLIDQPRYFDRDGLYGSDGNDYDDNCERFVFFNRAVLEAIGPLGLRPDIIHCNDWQTGLDPGLPEDALSTAAELAAAGSLLTIHNLAYLGLFWQWDMALTGLDWRLFNWRQLEFHGRLCFMKAGLVFADMLSTVSPTYAREIQTPRYGSGLDGLLRRPAGRPARDRQRNRPEVWSPSQRADARPQLRRGDASTAGKAACKAWLQRRAGLAERPDVPLFAQIGRLDPQKGWDLLAAVAERLLERDVQLVVLGEGDRKYHALLEDLARRYPGKCWAYLGFSDDLAHQIEAGADLFLMPSLFEPCGLNQLYSLAHGTVPIVRATGGLADTVVDTNPETLADGTANGFVFAEADPAGALADDRPGTRTLAGSGDLAEVDDNGDEGRLVLDGTRPGVCRSSTRRSSAGSTPETHSAGFERPVEPSGRHGRERLKFGPACSEQ